MKSKSSSKTRGFIKRVVNPLAWVDFDRVRAGQRFVVNVCSTLFIPQDRTPTETFAAAQKRLQLTPDDVFKRKRALFRTSLLMLLMACLIFIYTLYNLLYAHFLAAGLSLIVLSIALVLAFRYHFWYFQMKKQKLGCTLCEWFRQGLMGKTDA